MVICSICRLRFSNLKTLKVHYGKHSKSRIINYFLKFSILVTMPNIFRRRCKAKKTKQVNKKGKMNKQPKTKTLFMNENFHILCSQDEVIIGDDQNRFNSLFTFTNSSRPKLKKYITSAQNKLKKTVKSNQNKCRNNYSSRSSASSEASNNSFKLKRKFKRKKQPFRKEYHINISKLQNTQSLDDKTGEFYTCNCQAKNKISKSTKKADLQILTSDTESCSDTAKSFSHSPDAKLFCTKCGNGYRTKAELTEHMYIHETFCRLCNTAFPSKYKFREHMRLHIFKVYLCHICNAEFQMRDMFYNHFVCHFEDKTFENILDMEEEYPVLRYHFLNTDYNSSISNILYYLNDYPELNYYTHRFFTIHCDICRNEVLICDYARHLQSVHANFCY